MNTIYSTLPNTGTLRWVVYNSYPPLLHRYMYYSVNFIVTGEIEPGFPQEDFIASVEGYWGTWLQSFAAYPNYYVQWFCNFQAGGKSFSTASTIYLGEFGPQAALPDRITALLQLRTTTPGRQGTGYIHISPLFEDEFDGNQTTPAFYERVADFSEFLVTSYPIGGVTFIPSVWSRLTNNFAPIIEVLGYIPITSLRKRRITSDKHFNLVYPPFAWPS